MVKNKFILFLYDKHFLDYRTNVYNINKISKWIKRKKKDDKKRAYIKSNKIKTLTQNLDYNTGIKMMKVVNIF